MQRIAVIGGGAWGTALGQTLATAGRDITLWAREADVVTAVNADHMNTTYLPGVKLDPRLQATNDLAAAVNGAELILLMTPAQHTRAVAADLAQHVQPGTPAVICGKGIEQQSFALLSEAVGETLPVCPLAVLSGPTFAREVALGLPTAVTLACADRALGRRIVDTVGQPHFRPYLSDDVIGAQIGGAVKNVIAIACGIVEGRKLGDNARAALMTRGLAEVIRYGRLRGGRAETLMGLSGLGDLTLTCNSAQSRNMSLGIELGAGRDMADILGERRSIAEGVHTVGALVDANSPHRVDMPVCQAVDAVVNGGARIDAVIEDILSRPFKSETT